jgi:hypothetical protein
MFYLVALVVLVAVGAVVMAALQWAGLLVFGFALVAVVLVGALQLRNDDRISERNLLKLMGVVVTGIPARVTRRDADHRRESNQ